MKYRFHSESTSKSSHNLTTPCSNPSPNFSPFMTCINRVVKQNRIKTLQSAYLRLFSTRISERISRHGKMNRLVKFQISKNNYSQVTGHRGGTIAEWLRRRHKDQKVHVAGSNPASPQG